MEKYKPTVTLFLDKRLAKKSGKYPLKLTVYCKQSKKRYNTNLDLTTTEWEKVNSDKLRDESLKEIRFKMNAIRNRANTIIEALSPFSFQKFESKFFENAINLNDLNLSSLFDRYVADLNKKESVGTAINYKTTKNSLLYFKKNLSLNDITPDFLQEYEKYMIKNKKSLSTIGIYLRQLRSIYNDAISRNIISKDDYPFGKNKYVIPVSSNTKKALSTEEIGSLFNYKPENKEEAKALDFWKLSYLCNGMNFCDILKLKSENLKGDFIEFIRSKTKNTKKGSQQQIKVPILPQALEIINKWKNELPESEYIFPVLKEEHTPIQIKYLTQNFIKSNNKHMEAIRLRLNISQKCNTYSCRHSFATMLKRKNVNTEFISESLGHASITTTSAYLASFEDSTKREYANLLTDF